MALILVCSMLLCFAAAAESNSDIPSNAESGVVSSEAELSGAESDKESEPKDESTPNSSALESAPFEDSAVVVEEAPPDYSVWIYLIIGIALGGLVIFILVKPKKR